MNRWTRCAPCALAALSFALLLALPPLQGATPPGDGGEPIEEQFIWKKCVYPTEKWPGSAPSPCSTTPPTCPGSKTLTYQTNWCEASFLPSSCPTTTTLKTSEKDVDYRPMPSPTDPDCQCVIRIISTRVRVITECS